MKAKKSENPGQVCIANNGSPSFLNLDAANNFKHANGNAKPYNCSLPPLEAVRIPQAPDSPERAAGGQ
jgi:hypothetical protein